MTYAVSTQPAQRPAQKTARRNVFCVIDTSEWLQINRVCRVTNTLKPHAMPTIDAGGCLLDVEMRGGSLPLCSLVFQLITVLALATHATMKKNGLALNCEQVGAAKRMFVTETLSAFTNAQNKRQRWPNVCLMAGSSNYACTVSGWCARHWCTQTPSLALTMRNIARMSTFSENRQVATCSMVYTKCHRYSLPAEIRF